MGTEHGTLWQDLQENQGSLNTEEDHMNDRKISRTKQVGRSKEKLDL